MENFLKWSLIPAATILLSACNAVIVESYPSILENYNEGYFGLAATKRVIATIVASNPFSTQSGNFGAGNFEDRVRALMKDRVGSIPVILVPQYGANTTKPYRVVVVFNPRSNVDNRTICRMEKQTPMTANSPGQVSVAIVFCDGNNLKSGIGGRVGGVKYQNDPKFISLVRQVARSIIPPSGLLRQRQRDNGP